MADQLDDRLRAWADGLDDAIADARTDLGTYVEPLRSHRRSRTGMVAMAAAACLLIGSLAVVAAMVSIERDGSGPVATDDGSERPPPDQTTPTSPPEILDPVITDASPAVGSSFVTTEDGDRIGLVLSDEGTLMDMCVRFQWVDEEGGGASCSARNRYRQPIFAAGLAPSADEIAIFGAVGANGTTVRGSYPSGDTVAVETMRVPEMGGARVFALKVPLDTPLESVEVLSRKGDVLAPIETDELFRLLQSAAE